MFKVLGPDDSIVKIELSWYTPVTKLTFQKTMIDILPYYNFAVLIAQKAGKILLDHYDTSFRISYKGKGKNNLVTEVDHLTEKYLIETIQKKFPDHAILTEESGALGAKISDFRWIIDPLDGTTNYAHAHPFFAVSIALEYKHEIIAGIVYAPQLDEFFRAAKGAGTFLNNHAIKVSTTSTLETALLGTGFTYENKEKNLPYFEKFLYPSQGIRRCGAAAIDLAYIAAGRLDAFWEFRLKPWDVAAGKLLIEEAGGKVSNMDGSPLILDGENIVASNNYLHPEMLKNIQDLSPQKTSRKKKIPLWS